MVRCEDRSMNSMKPFGAGAHPKYMHREYMHRDSPRHLRVLALLGGCVGFVACEQDEPSIHSADAATPARPPRDLQRPVRVAARAGAFSVGNTHACAVTEQDRLVCWGDDRYGHLLDGAQGRVAEVAAGGQGHVSLLRDGDFQGAPDFESDIHETPFYGGPVAADPGPRGTRISYGHGRDGQGCRIAPDGSLSCIFFPRFYFTNYSEPNRWLLKWRADDAVLDGHGWTGITRHANTVGCGWRVDDGPACWTLGTMVIPEYLEILSVRERLDPIVPTPHEAYFKRRLGTLYPMPDDTEHLCASPYMACIGQGDQRVRCWRAEFGTRPATSPGGEVNEHDTHVLAADPFIAEATDGLTAFACGATSGPLLSPPPHRAAVCVSEANGVRCRVVGDGIPEDAVWAPHFGGAAMQQLDTNGLVVCGVDAAGKVRCEALAYALPTQTEIGRQTVEGLLNVPPALRP